MVVEVAAIEYCNCSVIAIATGMSEGIPSVLTWFGCLTKQGIASCDGAGHSNVYAEIKGRRNLLIVVPIGSTSASTFNC